jgi:hypothetical protein
VDLDSIYNKKSHIDKTEGYMNIYHHNIRGLATKLGELMSLASSLSTYIVYNGASLKTATNKT